MRRRKMLAFEGLQLPEEKSGQAYVAEEKGGKRIYDLW